MWWCMLVCRGVCRAHTCGYDLVYDFTRSFVSLQTAVEGNLCPDVARCGTQVLSASAQSFCSAPEMLLLTVFAPLTL